jgi:hypothetical protein
VHTGETSVGHRKAATVEVVEPKTEETATVAAEQEAGGRVHHLKKKRLSRYDKFGKFDS